MDQECCARTDSETFQEVIGDQISYHVEHNNIKVLKDVFNQPKEKVDVQRRDEDIKLSSRQAKKVVSSIPEAVVRSLKIDREELLNSVETIFQNGSAVLPIEYGKHGGSGKANDKSSRYFFPPLLAASVAHTRKRFVYIFDRFTRFRFISSPLIDQIENKARELRKEQPKGEIIFITGKYLEKSEGSDPLIDRLIGLGEENDNIFIYIVDYDLPPLLNFMLIDDSSATVEAVRQPGYPIKYCKSFCNCVYPQVISQLASRVNKWLTDPKTVRVKSKASFSCPIPEEVKERLDDFYKSSKTLKVPEGKGKTGTEIASLWIDRALKHNDPDRGSFSMSPELKDKGYEQLVLFHNEFKIQYPEKIDEIISKKYEVFAYYDFAIMKAGHSEMEIWNSLSPRQRELPFIWVHLGPSGSEDILKEDVEDLSPPLDEVTMPGESTDK